MTWPIIAVGWVVNLFQRGTASVTRINELLIEEPSHRRSPTGRSGHSARSQAARRNRIPRPLTSPTRTDSSSPNAALSRRQCCTRPSRSKFPPAAASPSSAPPARENQLLVSLIPEPLRCSRREAVLLDGRPLRDYPLETLRRNIGFVPQETFLFSETLRENICALASLPRPMKRSSAPPRPPTSAQEFDEFPERISDTMVGERGVTLSGGQKQRSAIARAVLRDPERAHPRRRFGQRRYLHRRADPHRTPPHHARPHHHLHLSPNFDGAPRRQYRGPRQRPHRRIRQPRATARPAKATTPASSRNNYSKRS